MFDAQSPGPPLGGRAKGVAAARLALPQVRRKRCADNHRCAAPGAAKPRFPGREDGRRLAEAVPRVRAWRGFERCKTAATIRGYAPDTPLQGPETGLEGAQWGLGVGFVYVRGG
ncbi:hypothetical protein Veis_5049 (plasmid) [Verminephrobacter eiseniae EF01-2]|uniref:Uncharacterized protein n=1 Tax=Verminephrobacter eiseniae (strain EF01-2) TaxID=391735 RepID=A1WSX8_VEREI|nr:hypothetical protein Veis_5049 [Verminephrobacter eiseniae EF01-2]